MERRIDAMYELDSTYNMNTAEGSDSMNSIADININNPIVRDPTSITMPTLEEALHQSEASSPSDSTPLTHNYNTINALAPPTITSASSSFSTATNRNIQNLRLNTQPPTDHSTDASLKSETSSIIPTSARLSIATTHHEPRFHSSQSPSSITNGVVGSVVHGNGNGVDIGDSNDSGNNGNVGAMLDSILANPGWNVATRGRARRNSFFSMRSLAPTLSPYEDLRAPPLAPPPPLQQEGDGEGVSGSTEKILGAGGSGCDMKVPIEDGGYRNHQHEEEEAGPSSPRPQSPPVPDPEAETRNALTAHYSRIVRTIDSQYMSELERLRGEIASLQRSHAEEMALMRNSIDAAYRVVLKKSNQEVEKAKESAASRAEELEREVLRWKEENEERVSQMEREREEEKASIEEVHRREVEKERNAVEDLWERRWRERMDLVGEEAGSRLRKRDQEWLRFLEKGYPDAWGKAKMGMVSLAEDDGG